MQALIVDLGLKSLLLASAGLLAHAMMHRRSAAFRATLLQSTMVALLALPLLSAVLPMEGFLSVAMPIGALAPNGNVTAELQRSPAATDMIGGIYLIGAAALLLRFTTGVWTVWRWTRSAAPSTDRDWLRHVERRSAIIGRPLRLRVSPHAGAPFSWGRGWIIIGPHMEAQKHQAESVIAHEAAHLRRGDWIGLIACRITTALFWFNPLVWLLARELVQESELAADAEALCDVAGHDYAQVLLAVACGGRTPRESMGMTSPSAAFAQRVTVSLAGRGARNTSRAARVALLACALGISAPIAAVNLTTPAPASASHDAATPQRTGASESRRKWPGLHYALGQLGIAIHKLTHN